MYGCRLQVSRASLEPPAECGRMVNQFNPMEFADKLWLDDKALQHPYREHLGSWSYMTEENPSQIASLFLQDSWREG